MLSTNEIQMDSSYSSLITDDRCRCHSNDEVISTFTSKHNCQHIQRDLYLSNIVIFVISLYKSNVCQTRKTFSVNLPLLSYSFLIRLINRAFNLYSNFTLHTKQNLIVTDDFDLDGCIMNQTDEHNLELIVNQYDIDDWCIIEDDTTDNFELIEIDNHCILVTIKSICNRHETLLQKATNWLHGSVNTLLNNYLTKKEFFQMLDSSTGRLLNEDLLRQRIYDNGCEQSIRKIVWCYLFRIFNQTMTNEDKIQYTVKAKERYNEMKQAWQSKQESEIMILENLIQKDVTRTDSSVKFFGNKKNLSRQKLQHILMTYCVYHPEPGYAQGMTDMAAPILYVIRDEALAYACFCALMRYMTPLFHSDGIAINRRLDLLRKTIQAIDIELWNKIEQCDISNLMFAYRWLLLDCKREFPFKDICSVFETLWASLPLDRFELNNNTYSDVDDLCPSSICSYRHISMISSITNTILSSHSYSSIAEENQSEHSSIDGGDSGYRDEQISTIGDLNINYSQQDNITITSCIPLEKWLRNFSNIDNEYDYSDMFTIFLCIALLEQNRSSIMQVSTINIDNDDCIGYYFTRLVRQNDAKQALKLARNYHKQYVVFQMRIKQLLMSNN
ncbi:unnamed protein product [Adineta steineri]|uniref:Rab-GAP TBC domain-containing protein n=1 Tax=Adineta steineri TaxID=433720 RepID=A0A819ANL2_9BILA|nr:unnamed protein product [Adineta steineri]